MASSSEEGSQSLTMKASALAVAMEAKVMVTTGRGDCQQLQDLLGKEDGTAKPQPAAMNPLLLASACSGSWEELEFLLNRGDGQAQPTVNPGQAFLDLLVTYTSGNSINGGLVMQQACDDVEAFLNLPPLSAASLLEGVTVEGHTALHAVATNGDGENFLRSADIIYTKAKHLLFVQNKKGDTPLHCAAWAGRSGMVSHLIGLARGEDTSVSRVKELLETENNLKETALHQAVRIGNNNIVELLMEEDLELASFPKDGTSPLYLAILLEEDIIADTLYISSHRKLSYSGQNGQNALHAAVLRGTELTKKLLEWNKDLTRQMDVNGSTPLHFAAALFRQSQRGSVCWQVLEANPAALYHSDQDGLFPIHVAASVGEREVVVMFLNKSPSCAGLHDAKGRTFLHVAVQKNKVTLVGYICRNRSLSWILNMQDNDGNTALHLAVQAGSLQMFCALLGNRDVHLNLTNKKGQTPLDISRYKIPPGLFDNQNSEQKIRFALTAAHARNGGCRRDHFEESYSLQLKHDEREESDKMKDSTQVLCIGSVLIATVTFGATFAVPGGYRADDHTNGGTPTLAGKFAFDAFMIASTFAFIFSSMATIGLMYSGSSIINTRTRRIYLLIALYFLSTSITCLSAAFALAVYVVLAPVAHKTAVAICVMSPLVVLCNKMEFWLKWALLVRPLCTRIGLVRTLIMAATDIIFNLFMEFWPFLFIFIWRHI